MERFISTLTRVAACCLLGSLAFSTAAGEIGFLEEFSLAVDRDAALKQLIPGTEDYYYYHCLNYQNSGQLDKVQPLLKLWIQRYTRTARVVEIEHRQALLQYDKEPKATLAYLIGRLGVQFNHQRQAEVNAAQALLPTTLDPKEIDPARLLARALTNRPLTTEAIESAGLELLAGKIPNEEVRRSLLSRLTRPDFPGLVKLIDEDLSVRTSGGFGSLGIHSQLTQAQLDELVKLRPDLINDANYVNAYMSKLRPSEDVDMMQDLAARKAYLERLWKFVEPLAPAFNSLKANVLYTLLEFNRSQGEWDKDLFMKYVTLPRTCGYIVHKYLELRENRDVIADLNADYSKFIIVRPIGTDEPLVRSYLMHFMVDAEDYKAFEPYIIDTYLKKVFAETKLLAGVGDAEKWFSLLDPAQVQALKDRVDVDFAYTNKTSFRGDEPVKLDVFTKNVKDLIVKVYQINTMNYYRTTLSPIGTDIDLDGLVANVERTEKFTEAPIRRVGHSFEFKEIKDRGVYIVEFIGNGKSSRALVQKGNLFHTVRTTAAGQVFTVWNENNEKVTGATITVGGQEYKADEDGTILVPFSNAPQGDQRIILSQGGFSRLSVYQPLAESYDFRSGFYVDRETLLRRRDAVVIVRPSLQINSTPISVKLLENVYLEIATVDREGVRSVKRVNDLAVFDDKDTSIIFRVPDNVVNVTFTLRAQIKSMATNVPADLADSRSFGLNGIDQTAYVSDLHLMHIDGKYYLDLLGKTGEALAGRGVNVGLKHRQFKEIIRVSLKTNAAGRIELGELPEITQISAGTHEGLTRSWETSQASHSSMPVVQGVAGKAVFIPYMGKFQEAEAAGFSLLEVRDGTFVADWTKNLKLGGGYLAADGLPAGDYSLKLKDSALEIRIVLAQGKVADGYVLGNFRKLELKNPLPLQIVAIEADKDNVKVKLTGVTAFTRVHLTATRYMPAYAIEYNLAIPIAGPAATASFYPPSFYVSGRDIGDEYRYILERKFAIKFPGNMLTRPGLLLNPWAIRKTETGQQAALSEDIDRVLTELLNKYPDRLEYLRMKREAAAPQSSDLDFLSQTSAVLVDLVPDKDGWVTVKRSLLGAHQQLHVLALDTDDAVYRELSLAEKDMKFLDLRLDKEALPADKHFTERKQISALRPGEQLVVQDIGSSRVEVYDSLDKVYRLYMALGNNATLAEFNFILQWPKLTDAQKREKYSQYACHELNFFLSRKDPAFFEKVVQPYLKNKKDKTFMDRYLLGEDLGEFTKPWSYRQLNTVERILLSQRIAGEAMRTARHIQDLYDLTPPNVELFNELYRNALLASGLESGGIGVKPGSQPAAAPLGASESESGGSVGVIVPEKSTGGGQDKLLDSSLRGGEAAAPAPTTRPEDDTSRRSTEVKAGVEMHDRLDQAQKEQSALGYRQADGLVVTSGSGVDAKLGELRKRRENVRHFYRPLDKTDELVENNYYHLPIEQQNTELVGVNAFWLDYAKYVMQADIIKGTGRGVSIKPGPFLSTNFMYAKGNFTEMMLALAVLDLPYEAHKNEAKTVDAVYTLSAASPMIVFHKEIKPALEAEQKTPILVGQNYFRADDRYRDEGNERFDKYVTDEFLPGIVYGCQVVVTNPTSTPRKLDVLVQIPRGAIPVSNGLYTKGTHIDLQPYATSTVEYFFYWPGVGEFTGLGVQVAKDEKLVGFAPAATFKVVKELSKVDRTSWEYVSQNGTADEVLAFLKDNNVERLNLDLIAWRMNDAEFFGKVTALLAARHTYNNTLWSYGLKHDNAEAIREFLQHQDDFVRSVGLYLQSPLLSIDPVPRKWYQHMEYAPVVNARAHKLGNTRTIVNERIYQQYMSLLAVLSHKPNLDNEDRMAVTYYMLLQDRVEEALAMLKQVDRAKLAEGMQYDYFQVYASFYTEDLAPARKLAAAYKDYPVDRWRKLFAGVAAQLDEIDGKAAAVVDERDRTQTQGQLAASEPAMEFTVQGGKVTLNYQNIESIRVNFYLMDVELLFSKSPFVQQGGATTFAYIQPNATADFKLPAVKGKEGEKALPGQFTFDLPKDLTNRNVMIEIVSGAVKRQQAYYANTMVFTMMENYGQLKVTDAKGKALAKAYVKVYARMKTGEPAQFYKDGYTDLRGRFDYTSLNTNELDNVERFSILVVSPENGAVVREAAPPKQ